MAWFTTNPPTLSGSELVTHLSPQTGGGIDELCEEDHTASYPFPLKSTHVSAAASCTSPPTFHSPSHIATRLSVTYGFAHPPPAVKAFRAAISIDTPLSCLLPPTTLALRRSILRPRTASRPAWRRDRQRRTDSPIRPSRASSFYCPTTWSSGGGERPHFVDIYPCGVSPVVVYYVPSAE